MTETADVRMHLASMQGGEFPYKSQRCCFIEQSGEELGQLRSMDDKRAAVHRAVAGDSRILAVWPGEYRSDLFWLDDLTSFALALGCAAGGKEPARLNCGDCRRAQLPATFR